MSGSNPKGYIAISRTIFDHPLFQTRRPFSRLEAWEWLIKASNWKPGARRKHNGMIELKRGQLTASLRELGKTWRWPKSNVDCFLRRLVTESMIALERAPLTMTRTATRTAHKTSPALITILNYNTFQKAVGDYGQRPGQRGTNESPQLPGILTESASEPNKQGNPYKESPAHLEKPRHLATSRDGQWLWCDQGSDIWRTYQADYRSVRGVDILPENRIGGRGNWFFKQGEAMRPKRRAKRA